MRRASKAPEQRNVQQLYSITLAKIFIFCIGTLTVCIGQSHSIMIHCTTISSKQTVELQIETDTAFTCKILRRATNVTVAVVQCIGGIKTCLHNNKYKVIRTSTGAIVNNLNYSENLLVSCFDPLISVAEYTNLVLPKDCLPENTTHTDVADGEYDSTKGEGQSSNGKIWIIVGPLLGGSVAVAIIAAAIVVGKYIRRKQRNGTRQAETHDPEERKPLADQIAESFFCTEAQGHQLTPTHEVWSNNEEHTSHELNVRGRINNGDIHVENANRHNCVGKNMHEEDQSGSERAQADKRTNDQITIRESEQKEMKETLERLSSLQGFSILENELKELMALHINEAANKPELLAETKKSTKQLFNDIESRMRRCHSL